MSDVLICLTVSDENRDKVIKGSHIRWCSLCACEVWVGPKTIEYVDDGSYSPMCDPCGFAAMENEERPEVHATPNASAWEKRLVREVNAALKRRRT